MGKHLKELDFTDPTAVEYWDKLYDLNDFTAYCYKKRMETALSWVDDLDLSPNLIILEAGCGAGRFAREAASKGHNVFGMDNSHEMIIKANNGSKSAGNFNAAFLQGNIEELPLKTSSFDVIVCLGVVGYLNSETKALKSIARAIKPGGILTISIVNKARLISRLDIPILLITLLKKIQNGMAGALNKGKGHDETPPVKDYYIPTFRKSLESAGFTVIEYRTVPSKLLTFCGKEIFPRKLATKLTLFIEKFSNIPIIGSFGGMCIFKAQKNLSSNWAYED